MIPTINDAAVSVNFSFNDNVKEILRCAETYSAIL